MPQDPPLHIEPHSAVADKVAVLQRFLGDRYVHDDSGIMYSMWFWRGDELRPFRRDDFVGMSMFTTKEGFTPEGHGNQENSAWNSGLFLWSQCLRHRVTGDDEARRFAVRAFRSLDAISRLSERRGEFGFLCKPYDLRASVETSADQYVAVSMGLWAYRALADAAERRRIDELLPAMADWWRRQDYELTYFGRRGSWLSPQNTPGFACLNLMANAARADDHHGAHLAEARRLIDLCGSFPSAADHARRRLYETGETNWSPKLHGYEYDPVRRPFLQWEWEERGATWLAAAAVAWLIENASALGDAGRVLARLLGHAVANYRRHMCGTLRPDLLTYYWCQTDLETERSYPLVRPRVSRNVNDYLLPFDYNFCAYQSQVCWGDHAARIPHACVLAHHLAPEFSPAALHLARRMLAVLDNRRLHWFIDPDGQQVMPEDRWMCDALSSEAPAMTCLAYWQARAWGIDL